LAKILDYTLQSLRLFVNACFIYPISEIPETSRLINLFESSIQQNFTCKQNFLLSCILRANKIYSIHPYFLSCRNCNDFLLWFWIKMLQVLFSCLGRERSKRKYC